MGTVAIGLMWVGIVFGITCLLSEKLEKLVLYAGFLLSEVGICLAVCYHETFGYFPPATPIVPFMEAICGRPQPNLIEQCLGILGGFSFPLLISIAAIVFREKVPLWRPSIH